MAITLVMVIFSALLGMLAGSVRTRLAEAPVVASETWPSMIEGWVQEVEPGRRVVRLLTKVHSISGLSAAATAAECAEMLCELITASGVDVSAALESEPTVAIGADEI